MNAYRSPSIDTQAACSRPHRAALGFALIFTVCAAGVAVAADGDQGSAADTTKPVLFLREMLVTGSRYPRAYYESPQALSFVSRRQIRELLPTAIGDVLAGLPGVDNSKDSPWEQRPVLRGLSGQRVLVLMDGSPMNSARGNGPHPSLVDPAQVERIEVVRGPSSVAYGSDALGGAINIITRQGLATSGNRSFAGSATIGGSSADRQSNGYLELMPRFGKLSTFLSSGARRAEDFESPNGKVPNSGFKDYNALFNLGYDLGANTVLRGGYQLYRGDDIGIPGLSFDMPGAKQDFEFSFYDRDYAHLTLERSHLGSWVAQAKGKLYWQREHRNFFSDQTLGSSMYGAFGVPPRTGSASVQTLQDRFFDLDTYGFQTQITSFRNPRYRLNGGIDLTRDLTAGDNRRLRTYYDASGNPVPSGGVVTAERITQSVPSGRFDNYAGYAQTEWYAAPRVTVSAGGRYTHYRYRTDAGVAAPAAGPTPPVLFEAMEVDDDAVSGSLGVVYEPIKNLHVTANVANGYRQPNAQDLFFNGAASVGFVLGNPDLKPEQSVSYDLGLRWGPGQLALSGNAFYSTYQDLIDAIQVAAPGPPTYQYVNISDARIWGGEAEAEWRFRPQWSTRAAVAGTVGDITSSEAIRTLYAVNAETAPLPGVPPFKGSLSLRWTNSTGRIWLEPSTRFSWRTNRLPLATPGVPQITEFKQEWIVGDLFAGVSFSSGQRLVLGVRNVTDTPYRQALASLEDPGISVVGSLSTDF